MMKITAKQIIDEISRGHSNYDYSGCEIEEELNLHITSNTSIKFEGSEFNQKIKIIASVPLNVNFNKAIFNSPIILNIERGIISCIDAEVSGIRITSNDGLDLDFLRCKLKGSITINDCKLKAVNFTEAEFISKTEFDSFFFEGNTVDGVLDFNKVKLHNAYFNRSKFNKQANFDSAFFIYSSTLAKGNFHNVTFEKRAYFRFANFDKIASFNESQFKDVAMLSDIVSTPKRQTV